VKWSKAVVVPLISGICCCGVVEGDAMPAEMALSATVLNEIEISSARASCFNPDDVLDREQTQVTGAVVLSPTVAGIRSRLRLEAARDVRRGIWIDPSVEVQELYTTFNVREGLQATVGKSFLSWDVSYASRPVNFFARETDYLDIRDYRRRISGVPMVALSWTGNMGVLTGVVASDCVEDRHRGQWALRAQGHRGAAEVAALIRGRSGGPCGFGGTVTYVQGRSLELHGSLFLNRELDNRRHRTAMVDSFPFPDSGSPDIYTKETADYTWIPHLVLGCQYTTESLVNILVEYIHDGAGFSRSQWDHLLRAAEDFRSIGMLDTPKSAVERNLFDRADALRRHLARQDYFFVRGSASWTETEGSIGALIGLADGGVSLSGTLSYQPDASWDVWAEVRRNMGPKGSEFGEVPERMRLTLMLRFLF
jgi:hypothetical protein